MTATYQTLRSVSDNHLFVICRDGEFYSCPEDVRKRGPWHLMQRGKIERLKADYRLGLARDGFVLVRCALTVFKPEA